MKSPAMERIDTLRGGDLRMLSKALALVLALAAISPSPQAWAAEDAGLGRLFLTPQQREDLERRRATNVVQAPTATVTTESLITINGRVTRSGGKGTTWINGQAQNDMPAGRDSAAVSLPIGEGEQAVTLRIGQTLDKGRGEIVDGLNGGEVKANPRRGK